MSEGLRERFIKIYSNLPLGIRQEIILVLDDGRPVTWNATYIEVVSDTPLSKKILEKLEKLKII